MNHRVKLRREDGVQVIDMPKGMELPGEEAVLRREEGRLILEPVDDMRTRTAALLAFLSTLDPLAEGEGLPAVGDDDLPPSRDIRL